MIVADFSREGLGLVARVHRAEGRVHPESGVTVETSVVYFGVPDGTSPRLDEPAPENCGP